MPELFGCASYCAVSVWSSSLILLDPLAFCSKITLIIVWSFLSSIQTFFSELLVLIWVSSPNNIAWFYLITSKYTLIYISSFTCMLVSPAILIRDLESILILLIASKESYIIFLSKHFIIDSDVHVI